MKYRKFRIAFSTLCGVFCLLLILLCVRSYWWSTIIISFAWDEISIVAQGQIFYDADYSWIRKRDNMRDIKLERFNLEIQDVWNPDGHSVEIYRYKRRIPASVAILTSVILATLATISTFPWIRLHFSLSTLLIAATLVAVILGIFAVVG